MGAVSIHAFDSPLGVMYCASTVQGLAILTLPGQSRRSFEQIITRLFPRHLREIRGAINLKTEKQMGEYFAGKRRTFSVTLDLRGTAFQKCALQQVAMIPYGQTMSYGQIAEMIGHPNASRAVGTANARNLLPIVIPCHRVVASNGLGGYGGGLPMKIKLLQLEGALPTARR